VKLVLYRCAQEGMTNAKRHGNATSIAVGIHYATDSIQMTVRNNGEVFTAEAYGYGLTALKRRLEEVQGTLRLENEDNGVKMTCTVPIGGLI